MNQPTPTPNQNQSPNPKSLTSPAPSENESIDDTEPQVMAVKVVNKNDFQIQDMFDGVPYRFLPHQPINVPVDAAYHIFGWHPSYTDAEGHRRNVDPEAMKRHVLKRFGWNTPDMMEHGRSDLFYSHLEICPIRYRMVPVEVDEEGNVVARQRKNVAAP